MARKKSTATIESEISKTEAEMTKIQDRYNKLADKLKDLKLKDLQEQKRQIESEEIMEAYLQSGKSLDEVMTLLKP